jgi:UDP-N-acetylmuramyl pentapeptide synthase
MPEFFVFEISIGGTGTADLGILTTLSPNYGIANNTALASDAKLQLIRNAKPGSVIISNSGADKALKAAEKSSVKVLTFRDPFNAELPEKPGESVDFTLETSCKSASPAMPSSERPLEVRVSSIQTVSSTHEKSSIQSESLELPVSAVSSGTVLHLMNRGNELLSASMLPGYNILAYKTAFIAASAAALELGIDPEAVVAVLEEFKGLSGRMQERELNGVALIDNSNSGMDILSAEKALEYALLKKKDERKGGIILVLGEEASQVCEGLPPALVQGFVERFGTKYKQIILVGKRMKAVITRNAIYADSLPEGLSKASELAGGNDIILSSVKCFR